MSLLKPVSATPEWLQDRLDGMEVRWRVSRGGYRCEGCEDPIDPGVRIAVVGKLVDHAFEDRKEGELRHRTYVRAYFQRFARLCVPCGEQAEREIDNKQGARHGEEGHDQAG